jgi:Flp pilus assembly protein TadD
LDWLPFFVTGSIFGVITYISQSRTSLAELPGQYSPLRIVLIVCHNIIFYLYKIIWPSNLPSHYAFPKLLGLSEPMVLAGVIGSCVLIVLLIISLRWTPAALTGWLFFFAAILPTMQIIGFSNVIASDKFAYLPSIGLLMVLCSFLGRFCGKAKPVSRGVAAAIVILILSSVEIVVTRRHLVHWRDSVSLYQHMLTVTPDAALLHYNLGVTFQSDGRLKEASDHYRKALQLDPYYHEAHNNLGTALQSQGKLIEAVSHYRLALQAEPDYAEAHNNLGAALEREGKLQEAISHFRKALYIKPDYAEAQGNLAVTFALQGNLDEAINHFRQALRISPNDTEAHYNLGHALQSQGKLAEAIMEYREALKIDPGNIKAVEHLKAAMTELRNRQRGGE